MAKVRDSKHAQCSQCIMLGRRRSKGVLAVVFDRDATLDAIGDKADKFYPHAAACRAHAEFMIANRRAAGQVGVQVVPLTNDLIDEAEKWEQQRAEGIARANSILAARLYGQK
jgi:hypothetical protein